MLKDNCSSLENIIVTTDKLVVVSISYDRLIKLCIKPTLATDKKVKN